MSVKKIINAVKKDNENRANKQRYNQDKQNREAKKKIRAESKAGMYKGGGLGKAKARELAEIVAKQDRKDREQYGGMDMPTKAKGGSVKKMAYGGKAMKMAKGGKLPMVKKDGKMVPAFAADGKGKMAYGGKVKKMADGGGVGRKIRNSKPVPMPNPKRSEFKSNMPQIDGEAREKAMREKLKKSTPKRPRYDSKKILDKITGRSASRRIASGGKVKKMAYGGSVKKTGARRGDGCAVKGKTRGRMV